MGSGNAYRRALEAWPEHKQRGSEGARTALRSAEQHSLAFAEDSELSHLEAALDTLEFWHERTVPGRELPELSRVRQEIARIRALLISLKGVDAALADGDLEAALAQHREALERLGDSEYDWSVGARVTLQLVEAQISSTIDTIEAEHFADRDAVAELLDGSERLLGDCKARPGADEATNEHAQLEKLLEEISALREQLEHRPPVNPEPPSPRHEPRPVKYNRGPLVLVATGITATGVAAGLLGESLAFHRQVRNQLDRLNAEASITRGSVVYDENIRRIGNYEDQARRRNIGLLVGGSALAASGITMAVLGAIRLRDQRRSQGSNSERTIRVVPSALPNRASLSLVTRF